MRRMKGCYETCGPGRNAVARTSQRHRAGAHLGSSRTIRLQTCAAAVSLAFVSSCTSANAGAQLFLPLRVCFPMRHFRLLPLHFL